MNKLTSVGDESAGCWPQMPRARTHGGSEAVQTEIDIPAHGEDKRQLLREERQGRPEVCEETGG